ncbi:MAG: hypothetical protein J6J18_05010 [Oscillospiraceae bacterium]|nr:hypothetical protein [Oscillospiraceae bacterium]
MKRLLPLLLVLLILCGCGADPAHPAGTEAPAEANSAESGGFYEPGSELELATGGAVQVYPLDRADCYGMIPIGEDILLFAGGEFTTLVKLSGSDLNVTAAADLDCSIDPEDASVQASEKGITYYDEFHQELVFLDINLKEVSRVSLPEDILGAPVLSADRKTLYYCTSDALRALDLETGLHKLLKEMYFEYQTVDGLHCDDTIIECSTADSAGNWNSLFVSAQTGEMLWETPYGIDLTTSGQSYFAVHPDGAYQEMLVGTAGKEPQALCYDGIDAAAIPLLQNNSVVLVLSGDDYSCVTLQYYDLESGKRTAALELSGAGYPYSIHADSGGESIWFLRYDDTYESDTIYRWCPDQTPTGDETVYLSARRSYENPDLEGLAKCEEKAEELSVRHGVDIRVWTDAVSEQPWDYSLQAEYQVPVILDSLEQLDLALSRYPAGFLKEAASGTSSGTLRIGLVRTIEGSAGAGTPNSVQGVQFWNDTEDAYICLIADSDLEQNLHHELFHIIDSRVLSTCSAYDNWEELNPEGFAYDYNYLTNQYREDYDLTEGDARAFIDIYSMSFPKEDRARIMEYAMMQGNESYFTSPVMQSKLHQLCIGIRQAFDLEESAESYRWEQYLAESLAFEGA